MAMNDRRDWLLLSIKWSKPSDDYLWWYDTACSGYTCNLLRAGRYTEAEARAEAGRCPQHLRAVPLDDAIREAEKMLAVPRDTSWARERMAVNDQSA